MHVIPPDEGPQLYRWWEPLVVLARKARRADPPWLVDLADFEYRGRVTRSGRRPALWVYMYRGSGLDVMCDDDGDTYRFVPFAESAGGRIRACDIDDAMFAAGVPFMPLEPAFVDDDATSDHDMDKRPNRSRRRRLYRPRSHPYLRALPDPRDTL